MKKSIAFIALIFCVGMIFSAYKIYEEPEYESIEFNDGFKNLKVLPQNISKDSLMGLMKSYNKALGVKCNHCHSKDKSADDVYAKEITRHMIKMTNELNEKEFNPIGEKYKNAINCATCHRGSTSPMKATAEFITKEIEVKK
ncbi:c-type cytochrome [Flavobacterium sp. I3-2]|uniref:c-type cytochrome n=1 Tax=Flavobacterium sp. I3-2 TaxID=2748319 RepID=UPI001C4A4E8C|nr:c-type cytochrome [Flavobacterium sp. I3-2]